MSDAIHPGLDLDLNEGEPADALRRVRGKASDDERLLDLFWNRADLKKQFSNLKKDVDDLKDVVKERDAEIQRILLDRRELENLLADPEKGYGALVYYQLRALWETARLQLTGFVDELSNQQKDRERKKQIMEFNQERQRCLQEVSQRIVTIKAEADRAKGELQAIEQRLAETTGLLSFFKRRRLRPEVEQHREHYETVRATIEELFDRRIKIESQPWPEYPGLSVDGKRVINLALIAMAQHLFIVFSEHSLGSMARVTTLKRLQEVDYGTKPDCEYLMTKIRESIHSMQHDREFASDLRARSKYLRSRVEYRSDTDTFPVPTSIGNIPVAVPGVELGNTVARVPFEINIMIEDYWGLSSVLLR